MFRKIAPIGSRRAKRQHLYRDAPHPDRKDTYTLACIIQPCVCWSLDLSPSLSPLRCSQTLLIIKSSFSLCKGNTTNNERWTLVHSTSVYSPQTYQQIIKKRDTTNDSDLSSSNKKAKNSTSHLNTKHLTRLKFKICLFQSFFSFFASNISRGHYGDLIFFSLL